MNEPTGDVQEIYLGENEHIIINGVKFKGFFFDQIRSVKYLNQLVMILPNPDEGTSGVLYRGVKYADIRDEEIAEALKLYIETKHGKEVFAMYLDEG